MAMAAVYTTINGMLVHESRGGVESFYFPDTLGNLTTVRSATGVKTYGAEYWPYGEIQTETGTNPSPWSFVGLYGYLRDTASRLYVRARHYLPGLARWQTVDPLWPRESAYGYVGDSPTVRVDIFGLRACEADPCRPNDPPNTSDACIAVLCSIKSSADAASKLKDVPDCLKSAAKKLLKEIKDRKDNFNPSDCCKTAHGGGGFDVLSLVIGLMCKSARTGCPPVETCRNKTRGQGTDACNKCCEKLYAGGSLEDRCKFWCS